MKTLVFVLAIVALLINSSESWNSNREEAHMLERIARIFMKTATKKQFQFKEENEMLPLNEKQTMGSISNMPRLTTGLENSSAASVLKTTTRRNNPMIDRIILLFGR